MWRTLQITAIMIQKQDPWVGSRWKFAAGPYQAISNKMALRQVIPVKF